MKRLRLVLGCLLCLSILTACNSETENKAEGEMKTIQDVKGEVSIPVEPQRIVDLSGNSDILSILGYKVAGTANSDAYDYTRLPSYLEETLQGAKILGYSMQDTMDVEAILNVQPDLIIISTVQEKMYNQLKEIAPTVMLENEALNWKEDIRNVARVFEQEEKAEQWIKAYEEKATKIGEKIKQKQGSETTYLSFLASGGQFFIFSGAGFGDVLYNDLKLAVPAGMPKQSDISLPVVTYEGLAQIDADQIFLITTDEMKLELDANSVWNHLKAVEQGHVITLSSSPYFNQGYSPIGRELLLDEIEGMLDDAS